MNFTREPIIETVIMPREGCKLLVRNSKGGGQEEYYVDSIEVVSFGRSLFFRSQERPKSFLVPVGDYEVLEMKEVRMALKNVTPERSIKIGGGREGPVRQAREPLSESEAYEPQEPLERPPMDDRGERKRDKRRRGRRGGGRPDGPLHEPREMHSSAEEPFAPVEPVEGGTRGGSSQNVEARGEEQKSPSFISKLFPPPPTLIKDSLSRYKTAEVEEGEIFPHKEGKLEETLFDSPPLSEDISSDEDDLFPEN